MTPRDDRLREDLAAHVEALGYPFAAAFIRGGVDVYVRDLGNPPVGQGRALEALNAGEDLILRRPPGAPLEELPAT